MDEKKMFCPVIRMGCKEDECAFWVKAFDHCAVNWIAQSLNDQADILAETQEDLLDLVGSN